MRPIQGRSQQPQHHHPVVHLSEERAVLLCGPLPHQLIVAVLLHPVSRFVAQLHIEPDHSLFNPDHLRRPLHICSVCFELHHAFDPEFGVVRLILDVFAPMVHGCDRNSSPVGSSTVKLDRCIKLSRPNAPQCKFREEILICHIDGNVTYRGCVAGTINC